LADIAEGLDKGSFSSVQLVKADMPRIREVDDEFRSVIELNPEALSVALQLDAEMKISGRRG
jgi:amidase